MFTKNVSFCDWLTQNLLLSYLTSRSRLFPPSFYTCIGSMMLPPRQARVFAHLARWQLCIQYVHAKSNHPPVVLKNIPAGVNKILSEISSNEEMFNKAAPIYQKALDESGHNFKLKYQQKSPEKRRTGYERSFGLTHHTTRVS